MNRFLFIMLICLTASCRVVEEIPTTDSTRIKVCERVVIVHDTSYVSVPEQSISQNVRDSISHLETDIAVSEARIMPDGSLSHSIKNKAQNIPLVTDKEIHYRDSIVEREKKVPVPVPVEKELSWWEKIKQLLGGIAIGIIVLYISAKIIVYKFRG